MVHDDILKECRKEIVQFISFCCSKFSSVAEVINILEELHTVNEEGLHKDYQQLLIVSDRDLQP